MIYFSNKILYGYQNNKKVYIIIRYYYTSGYEVNNNFSPKPDNVLEIQMKQSKYSYARSKQTQKILVSIYVNASKQDKVNEKVFF